jgi:hypothetical protein
MTGACNPGGRPASVTPVGSAWRPCRDPVGERRRDPGRSIGEFTQPRGSLFVHQGCPPLG